MVAPLYMKQHVVVIIPVYNEAENVPILVKKIFLVLPLASVIIVDDSAHAQNAALKSNLRTQKGNVRLISRGKKSGRGSAVIRGFSEAVKDKTITHFFEMDADLTHDPAELTKFLENIGDFDMIIGSRYIEGSYIHDWPLIRLVLSKCINTFLNLWLHLSITDYTNGYRLYTRRAVEYLLSQKLRETGFISLTEMAYRLNVGHFRIKEIPTSFTDRLHGKSSAGVEEHVRSLIGALRIRFS
jgi:dolichol-phosphate mannosyltransferase